MKKARRYLVAGVIVFAAIASLSLWRRMEEKIYKSTIETQGESFVISVYTLPEPLKIKPVYEPRADLDLYPWFRSLLFFQNGFEETVPVIKWTNYTEVAVTEKGVQQVQALNKQRREIVFGSEKDVWADVYSEINDVVLCRFDGGVYLSFYLNSKKGSENFRGGLYTRLKWIDGRWKHADEGGEGQKRCEQMADCYKRALEMKENGTLKARPISKLKR